MSEEKKKRRNGEGWATMSFTPGIGYKIVVEALPTAKDAEMHIKDNPDEYGKEGEILIAKIQKRIKLKVETKTVVTFE